MKTEVKFGVITYVDFDRGSPKMTERSNLSHLQRNSEQSWSLKPSRLTI